MSTATTPAAVEPSRFSRYETLIPPASLLAAHCLIVGVGAIGHQLARLLASIGVGNLTLIDFDTVELANLGPQAWPADSIGMRKADVAAAHCKTINPECNIRILNTRFAPSMELPPFVFSCVDSMETRRQIFDAIIGTYNASAPIIPWFFDSRMSVETGRIITTPPNASGFDYYERTLFSDAEAFAGQCTAKSTIHCATFCASLLVSSFTQILRSITPDRDISFNLLSFELFNTPSP